MDPELALALRMSMEDEKARLAAAVEALSLAFLAALEVDWASEMALSTRGLSRSRLVAS